MTQVTVTHCPLTQRLLPNVDLCYKYCLTVLLFTVIISMKCD